MNDSLLFENSRSGDYIDIQRAENAYKRWERDLPHIKRAAYGRFAPKFCYGKPGINIRIRQFSGNSEDFYLLVEIALRKRFYQPETRRKYLSSLKQFLNWLTIPVNRVTDKCVYAYLCSLSNSRMHPSTYSLHLSALRTIFDCFCNLDITVGMELPKIKKVLGVNKYCRVLEEKENSLLLDENIEIAKLQKIDIEVLFSVKHSNRDIALFAGVVLLDLKLNELLNIRCKDLLLNDRKVVVWAGLGRQEREIELPKILLGIFTKRMNELRESDYLFSSTRNSQKALTGQGANKIIQKMFYISNIERKINCRLIASIESSILREYLLSRGFNSTIAPVRHEEESMKCVGNLSIDIGELISYKRVVSAKVELHVSTQDGERVRLKGITISTLSYNGPSISFPLSDKWSNELLWLAREEKERISSVSFKDKISDVIKMKYLEKKKSCYIRKKRVNDYWARSG